MKHLAQQFTAHPIGQGLFYSGRVNITGRSPSDSSFNFVFDCGSLNTTNADEEVGLYRNRHLQEDDAILDLLVISHFDADHVSHIKKLLDKRKVKKVVLPFATLEERLFLVLKYYNNIKGRTRLGDDFPIRFMLDPIGSLGDYLDGDSTIYIVNSDPDKPFDGPGGGNDNESNLSRNDVNGLIFDVNATEIDSTVTAQFSVTGVDGGKVKMFSDAEKCYLKFGYSVHLMEFLFYRRNVGKDNDQFFEAVYKEFCETNSLIHNDKSTTAVNALIEKVKGINSATAIKNLFHKVKKNFTTLFTPGHDIVNLNTTALCMMHYNLRAIYTLGHPEHYWIQKDIIFIKKFDGTNRTRIEDTEHCIYPYQYYWHSDHPPVRFPNCLLTSDNFLKTTGEVNELYIKYQHYWERFWLFQVPHHGSASSAGLELLNRLPHRLAKFINYGTTHQFVKSWRHPSPQLINDLVSAGQSVNVLPINEFTGLRFEVNGRP